MALNKGIGIEIKSQNEIGTIFFHVLQFNNLKMMYGMAGLLITN